MSEPARFRPRFTLVIVYFAALVVFFCSLVAAPAVIEGLRTLPPDADPAAAGREVWRAALRGRVPFAVGAAVISLAGLLWARLLPGLRAPPD